MLHPNFKTNLNQLEPTRIGAIDGFRAVAMLLVLAFHSWEFSGAPKWNISIFGITADLLSFLRGNSRVDFFIVLSGFCLFLPVTKLSFLKHWNSREYAKRRAQRILPAYYVALVYAIILPYILTAITRTLGYDTNWQKFPSLFDVVAHVLFLHTLFAETWASINGSLWTMALEVQFYIIFPLIVITVRRYRMRAIGGMILISVLYRILAEKLLIDYDPITQFLASIFVLGRLMQFALGILMVWFVMRQLRQGRLYSPLIGTLGVLAACTIHYLAISDLANFTAGREIFLGIAFSVLIVSICLTTTPIRILFENRLISGIGFISYSLFLVHQPTIYYLSEFMNKFIGVERGVNYFFIILPLGFVATLIVGYPLFYFVERPYLMKQIERRKESALLTAPEIQS